MNKKIAILLLAALAFLGGLAACGSGSAAQIAVYGDSRDGEAVHRKLVAQMLAFKPSAVFMTGDLVHDGKDLAQWARFKEITAPLFASAKYYPALGNHDLGLRDPLKMFPDMAGRPGYSVEAEGAHWIVLDSDESLQPDSAQYAWLVSDLRAADKSAAYIIVVFHHAMFCAGGHQEDEKGLKPVLLPLFKQYNVSAVFAGHDHSYQRFEFEGRPYIVTGGGGAPLYGQARKNPYLKKFRKEYHFCIVSPGRGFLKVRVYNIDGKKIDEFFVFARKAR